jgi:hypothetical protein
MSGMLGQLLRSHVPRRSIMGMVAASGPDGGVPIRLRSGDLVLDERHATPPLSTLVAHAEPVEEVSASVYGAGQSRAEVRRRAKRRARLKKRTVSI